jgi:hypothetical protein
VEPVWIANDLVPAAAFRECRGWAGRIRESDLNYVALAGLAPHSDAHNYFSSVFDQI